LALRSTNQISPTPQRFQASREGGLNWFAYQITNALTEGLISVIQGIKTAARGFRNAASYRILCFAGKLELQA
jgi:transposase